MWEASDDALLAGYATGDRDAATMFVRRFQSKVFGLAMTITRDPVNAEDVAQDSFVRAWRYANSYDPRRGSVASWLLGITRNVALDRVRISTRRGHVNVGELPEDDDVIDERGDFADAVGTRDEARRVAASFDVLPPEQRQTLIAMALQGLSAHEVSELTNVPLGTVKTRMRLGLRKLRDQLEARTP